MKIITIALAAATMAAFATTTTATVAAPRGDRAVSNRAGPPKTRRPLRRLCRPVYARICHKGLPCRYLITGYVCRQPFP